MTKKFLRPAFFLNNSSRCPTFPSNNVRHCRWLQLAILCFSLTTYSQTWHIMYSSANSFRDCFGVLPWPWYLAYSDYSGFGFYLFQFFNKIRHVQNPIYFYCKCIATKLKHFGRVLYPAQNMSRKIYCIANVHVLVILYSPYSTLFRWFLLDYGFLSSMNVNKFWKGRGDYMALHIIKIKFTNLFCQRKYIDEARFTLIVKPIREECWRRTYKCTTLVSKFYTLKCG